MLHKEEHQCEMIGNEDQLFSDSKLKMMSEIYIGRLVSLTISKISMAEWLRRWTAKLLAKMVRVQIPSPAKFFSLRFFFHF